MLSFALAASPLQAPGACLGARSRHDPAQPASLRRPVQPSVQRRRHRLAPPVAAAAAEAAEPAAAAVAPAAAPTPSSATQPLPDRVGWREAGQGLTFFADGSGAFRVWAPHASRVTLQLVHAASFVATPPSPGGGVDEEAEAEANRVVQPGMREIDLERHEDDYGCELVRRRSRGRAQKSVAVDESCCSIRLEKACMNRPLPALPCTCSPPARSATATRTAWRWWARAGPR